MVARSKTIKTYDDLCELDTFNERYKFLKDNSIGDVGADTFGDLRYLNQQFYSSREWKRIRDIVILRDNGCDLGIQGMDIVGPVYIHHINPITPEDIIYQTPYLKDPKYLISMSQTTHNTLHYRKNDPLLEDYSERRPGDTCPWK